jgi:hypothetical protein
VNKKALACLLGAVAPKTNTCVSILFASFRLLIKIYQLLSGVCGLLIRNFDPVNLILLELILYSILVQICQMHKRTYVRRLITYLSA